MSGLLCLQCISNQLPLLCAGCDGTGVRGGGSAAAPGSAGAGHGVGGVSPPTPQHGQGESVR